MSGTSSNQVIGDIVTTIRRRLKEANVKLAWVIEKLESRDKNLDGHVHTDDLEDVLREVIHDPENRITRREVLKLASLISGKVPGSIIYERLYDILEPTMRKSIERPVERWVDDAVDDSDTRWASQPGTVGEWLKKAACPAEIKNFKKFIGCLERFERDTGMKIAMKDDGNFIVPLGPDLRANIGFHMS